jgi:hypothetical protein
MRWLDKIMGMVPLDYETGYIDGFTAGLKFYKESIDMLHEKVLGSEKVKEEMRTAAKNRRIE